MSRPAKTFLIESDILRFRVDLRKTADTYSVVRVIRAESGGDASAGPDEFEGFDPVGGASADTDWIAPLLKLRPRPASEITVLSDRFTAVIADLPGASGEDWRSSAEMEAQTISGLSSSEAMAAMTRLPAESGMVRCWIVQVSMRRVAAMRSAVAGASKSRLVSVGHPAGVRLDSAAPQLEHWNEFALFHSAGGERIDLRGWNGPDALAEAREDGDVAAALAVAGVEARLLFGAPDDPQFNGETVTAVNLSDPNAAEIWSDALAQACDPLTGKLLGLPLFAVPKSPPSPAVLVTAATSLALIVALLLGGHWLLNQRRLASLETNLTMFQTPADEIVSMRKRVIELRRELKEIRDQSGDTNESEVNVYAHRRRIGGLLEGIAAGAEVREAVVLEFHPDKLDTVLTGVATTFNAPQVLARRIDEALAANGWRAELVRRTARLLRPDGGPWSFELRLTPGRPVSVMDATAMPDSDASSNPARPVGGGNAAPVTF